MQCTFFGTGPVYLTDGVTGIFTDAFLTRPALSKLKSDDEIGPDVGPDVELIRENLKRDKVEKLDAIFVAHSSESIMILASADYVPGKLDSLENDICYLGIGAMGSKDEDFRQKYWKETVKAMRPEVIVPVHWDNFGEPLVKSLEPLPDFIDNISESKAFLERKRKESGFVLKWQDACETICPFDL